MPVTNIKSEWVSGNLVFFEDAVGQSVTGDVLTLGTAAVKVGGTSQDVDFQFYATGGKSFIIDAGAGTLTLTGITLVNAAPQSITVAALTAGDAYSGLRTVVTANNPANTYGVSGYFEADLTGTLASEIYGFGSWINFDVDAKCGSHGIYAQDNGIYAPAAMGSDISSAKLVIGMRMECVIDDGQNPGSLFLFSTNIYSNTLTALFDVNAIVDMGGASGAATGNDYKIPLIKDATAGQVWYVNLYHA